MSSYFIWLVVKSESQIYNLISQSLLQLQLNSQHIKVLLIGIIDNQKPETQVSIYCDITQILL